MSFETPSGRVVVSREQLEAFIGGRPANPQPPTDYTGADRRLLVDQWLESRAVSVKRVKDLADGRRAWILAECPFNEKHGSTSEVAIFQWPSGKLGAECKHNSCQGNHWPEFKSAIGEPADDHWNPPKSRGEILPAAAALAERFTSSKWSTANDRDTRPRSPGVFPESLATDAPGILGDIVKFTLRVAPTPSPVLALAGALPLLGMIYGRKVEGSHWGTRTNLYTVAIAPSGYGKEQPRTTNFRIADALGLLDLVEEQFASGPAVASALESHPSMLFQPDEAGELFRATTGSGSPAYLRQIRTSLTQVYGKANTVWKAASYADRSKNPPRQIRCPNLCLFCTSTPAPFYESFAGDGGDANGFLGRFLVFAENRGLRRQVAPNVSAAPPQSIIDRLLAWDWSKLPLGNIDAANLPMFEGSPIIVEYEADAKATIDEFVRSCDRYAAKAATDGAQALWARAPEKANKFALIAACAASSPSDVRLTDAAVRWGVELADWCIRSMIFELERYRADGQWQKDLNKVRRFFERYPAADTRRIAQHTRLRVRDIEEFLQHLILAGDIEADGKKCWRVVESAYNTV